MDTTNNEEIARTINHLIDLLQKYKRDISESAKIQKSGKLTDDKMSLIVSTVKEEFPEAQYPQRIEFGEIRKAVKQRHGITVSNDDICVTFVDDDNFGIMNTRNKYMLQRLTDASREEFRKSHAKLMEKFRNMKSDRGFNVPDLSVLNEPSIADELPSTVVDSIEKNANAAATDNVVDSIEKNANEPKKWSGIDYINYGYDNGVNEFY